MVDDQTQRNFITCLASLRLLAKVLGLLVSLPYRSECNTTKEIIMTQVEIRSKACNIKFVIKKHLLNFFSNLLISLFRYYHH